jgi:hypothetical protein
MWKSKKGKKNGRETRKKGEKMGRKNLVSHLNARIGIKAMNLQIQDSCWSVLGKVHVGCLQMQVSDHKIW